MGQLSNIFVGVNPKNVSNNISEGFEKGGGVGWGKMYDNTLTPDDDAYKRNVSRGGKLHENSKGEKKWLYGNKKPSKTWLGHKGRKKGAKDKQPRKHKTYRQWLDGGHFRGGGVKFSSGVKKLKNHKVKLPDGRIITHPVYEEYLKYKKRKLKKD